MMLETNGRATVSSILLNILPKTPVPCSTPSVTPKSNTFRSTQPDTDAPTSVSAPITPAAPDRLSFSNTGGCRDFALLAALMARAHAGQPVEHATTVPRNGADKIRCAFVRRNDPERADNTRCTRGKIVRLPSRGGALVAIRRNRCADDAINKLGVKAVEEFAEPHGRPHHVGAITLIEIKSVQC